MKKRDTLRLRNLRERNKFEKNRRHQKPVSLAKRAFSIFLSGFTFLKFYAKFYSDMKNFSAKGDEDKSSSSPSARLRLAREIEELLKRLIKIEDCL